MLCSWLDILNSGIAGLIVFGSINTIDPDGYHNICAEAEERSLEVEGENPLGELESEFARIRGSLTIITKVSQKVTRNQRASIIRLKGQTLTEAGLYFDTQVPRLVSRLDDDAWTRHGYCVG
jgi:hypothetical protein